MNAPEKHEERVITDELLGIARKHIGATLNAGGEGWLMPPGLTHRLFPGREPLKL